METFGKDTSTNAIPSAVFIGIGIAWGLVIGVAIAAAMMR